MSENEFDVQRDRTEDDRDNPVLTGEEIELPGEDSDAAAIIGESSEPIHTGEIESVAISGVTGRGPAAAPLKPAIEDRISTGELPVVPAAAGDAAGASCTDRADSASSAEEKRADTEENAPASDALATGEGEAETPATDEAEEPTPAAASSDAPVGEPADDTSAQDMSEQDAPTDDAPAQETSQASASDDDTPTQTAPEESAPADDASAQATPEESAPTRDSSEAKAPTDEAPMQTAPEENPAADFPTPDDAPAQETSQASASIDDTPTQTAPEESAPAADASAQAAPEESAPTRDSSEEKAPTDETPTQIPPVQKPALTFPTPDPAPSRDTPEDNGPTDDAPTQITPLQKPTLTFPTPDPAPTQVTPLQKPGPAFPTGDFAPTTDASKSTEEPGAKEPARPDAPFSSLDTSARREASPSATRDQEPAPKRPPIMTPAQAAAVLGLNLDAVRDVSTPNAPVSKIREVGGAAGAAEEETRGVTGGVAEPTTDQATPYSLPSRRTMIFGDEEPLTPSTPASSYAAKEAPTAPVRTAAPAPVTEPEPTVEPPRQTEPSFAEATTQLPAQAPQALYSFEDQDAAETTRPRRRSLLSADEGRDAETLAAIASSAGRDRSDRSGESHRLDDELFSAAPQLTEMPSRTGAHWASLVGFLVFTPLAWYLAADAGARMTLADSAPMFTGVASIQALGELLGAVVIAAILFVLARRSSLGAWIMGAVALLVGLPWVLAPGFTASALLSALTSLRDTGPLGANLMHHLQASGYSGRFVVLGAVLMGIAYVSHSARRTGRSEEALRTSLEVSNPTGAFYSKRARKRAAKDAGLK
ncbi:prepilin peptidase [Schaalia meyeri]|uniref:prepilin peptidase n=1 Tax=Schaalia meyeri TaxID=52773 RepID=UPI0006803CD2|nr:prepilin peptidase [Schaalia meyeri]